MNGSITPSPQQLAFHNMEFGMFLHFGLRSWYERLGDKDVHTMDPKRFTPAHFDCRQWAETAKAAGMKYMVLTAKHHDGWCNWQTATSDFSVKSSPWKNGKGDVVREYTEACRAAGLGVGLYFSPADWTCAFYSDAKRFNDYMLAQLTELLGNYGRIDLLWFDLAYSTTPYDWPRIVTAIRRLQPDLLMNAGAPNMRHGGSEGGFAEVPLCNIVREWQDPSTSDTRACEPQWLPVEVCSQMRHWAWFWHAFDTHTVKDVETLMGLYLYSVGRGANLLLNVGPDNTGLLPEPDRTRLLEFAAERDRRFGTPLLQQTNVAVTPGQPVVWDLPTEPLMDALILQEDLIQGEHVSRWTLRIMPAGHTIAPRTLREGYTIGHKQIVTFPRIRVKQIILELELDAPTTLTALQLFGVTSPWA